MQCSRARLVFARTVPGVAPQFRVCGDAGVSVRVVCNEHLHVDVQQLCDSPRCLSGRSVRCIQSALPFWPQQNGCMHVCLGAKAGCGTHERVRTRQFMCAERVLRVLIETSFTFDTKHPWIMRDEASCALQTGTVNRARAARSLCLHASPRGLATQTRTAAARRGADKSPPAPALLRRHRRACKYRPGPAACRSIRRRFAAMLPSRCRPRMPFAAPGTALERGTTAGERGCANGCKMRGSGAPDCLAFHRRCTAARRVEPAPPCGSDAFSRKEHPFDFFFALAIHYESQSAGNPKTRLTKASRFSLNVSPRVQPFLLPLGRTSKVCTATVYDCAAV